MGRGNYHIRCKWDSSGCSIWSCTSPNPTSVTNAKNMATLQGYVLRKAPGAVSEGRPTCLNFVRKRRRKKRQKDQVRELRQRTSCIEHEMPEKERGSSSPYRENASHTMPGAEETACTPRCGLSQNDQKQQRRRRNKGQGRLCEGNECSSLSCSFSSKACPRKKSGTTFSVAVEKTKESQTEEATRRQPKTKKKEKPKKKRNQKKRETKETTKTTTQTQPYPNQNHNQRNQNRWPIGDKKSINQTSTCTTSPDNERADLTQTDRYCPTQSDQDSD